MEQTQATEGRTATSEKPPKRGPGRPPKSSAIKVKALSRTQMAGQKTAPYWIGVISSCPIQNFHLFGHCFHRWVGVLHQDPSGNVDTNSVAKGQVVDLTADMVEGIKASALNKIVRFVGDRGVLVSLDSKSYGAVQDSDTPVAAFVWMHRAGMMSAQDMLSEPETMME